MPVIHNIKTVLVFAIQPESLRHNPLFFELCTKLAWNPKRVEMKEFLNNYAHRRYGKDSAEAMAECMEQLVASVYSINGWPTPLYQVRLDAGPNAFDGDWFQQALECSGYRFIPHIRKALEICLAQERNLKTNIFFRDDLLEITRSYLREVLDYTSLE